MNKTTKSHFFLAIPMVTSYCMLIAFTISGCESPYEINENSQSSSSEESQIQALNNLTSRTGLFDLRFQNVNSVDLTQSSPPPTTGGGNGNPGPSPTATPVANTTSSSGTNGGTNGGGNGGLVQISGTADFYPDSTTGQTGTAEPDFIARLNITAVFELSLSHGSQCLADAQVALENGVGFEIIGTGTLVPLPCYATATNPETLDEACAPEPIANSGSGTSSSSGASVDITSIIVSPPVVGDPLPPFRTPFAGVDFQSIENCMVIPTTVIDPPLPQPQPVAQ